MNDELHNEYLDWLNDKQNQLNHLYIEIFNILTSQNFDCVVKEIGNPLIDMDDFIKGLEEYSDNLEELTKPKEPPKFKLED